MRNLGIQWPCSTCGKCFVTKQAMAMHMRAHHAVHIAHSFIYVTYCTVCLVEFHTRPRVLAHFSDESAICLANLKLRGRIFSLTVVEGLDKGSGSLQRECRIHGVHKPCIQLQGPLLPVLQVDDRDCTVMHPLGFGHSWK